MKTAIIAWQVQVGTSQTIKWEHRDPSGASFRMTDIFNQPLSNEAAELDPLGQNAGLRNPSSPHPSHKPFGIYPSFGDGLGSGGTQCLLDGVESPCSLVMQSISNGSAQQCPNNNCGPQVIRDSDGHQHLAPLTTDPNTGQLGYSYIQYEQGKVHIDGYPDTIGSMIPHLRYAAANVSDTNNFLFASWQQQNPNSAANTASGIQKSNPCEGKAYADLDYYTPQPRGKNRPMESGIEHITRRHILLDSGGYYRITDPRTFVPTPQQASKYIFDSFVASLAEAQAFVIAANGMIFDEAQKNQTFYRDRATGNYVFYHNFGVAFNPQSNTAAWGIGVQRRTSTLTLTGTLVVNKDCSRVVTSFPGNP